MKLNKAIETLTLHNAWRRGDDTPITDPKELGIAIDTILDALRWRSVEEELPPMGEEVLFYRKEWVVHFRHGKRSNFIGVNSKVLQSIFLLTSLVFNIATIQNGESMIMSAKSVEVSTI